MAFQLPATPVATGSGISRSSQIAELSERSGPSCSSDVNLRQVVSMQVLKCTKLQFLKSTFQVHMDWLQGLMCCLVA